MDVKRPQIYRKVRMCILLSGDSTEIMTMCLEILHKLFANTKTDDNNQKGKKGKGKGEKGGKVGDGGEDIVEDEGKKKGQK